ncbi:Crp/Fnr family transcriptional regulator [Flavonifractor hominis]|uniref:Crp/Fnr family transcriptional regulator n=1 Tax=Flavonifractor hominis TaxID=3133178 RepID=A0ABV1ES12_9FIRM
MDMTELCGTALFRGVTPEEAQAMLSCLASRRQSFAKGQAIYRTGDTVTALGVVLSGRVLIESCDLWGNVTVLDSVGPGQIFAETYACTPTEPLMVDVVAAEPSEALFLEVERVLHACPNTCAHHSRLVRNLLTLSAQKNLNLSRKIFHTSPKTIRGRLLSYLSEQAVRSGGRSFTIPFDRQQLADYLNVERSALSGELGRMQREGLLRTRRNHFELLADHLEL